MTENRYTRKGSLARFGGLTLAALGGRALVGDGAAHAGTNAVEAGLVT